MKSQFNWLSLPALLMCTNLELALCIGLLGALVPMLVSLVLIPLQPQLTRPYLQVAQLLLAALLLSLLNLLLARFDLALQQSLEPWLGLLLLPLLSSPRNHSNLTALKQAGLFFVLALTLGLINSTAAVFSNSTDPWFSLPTPLAQPSLNFILLGLLLALTRLFNTDTDHER